DDSDQLVVLEHRHADYRMNATEFDPGDGPRIAVGIGLGLCKVGKVGRLLRSHYLAKRATWGRTERAATARLGECRGHVVRSDNPQSVPLAEVKRAEFGLAKPGRVLQHGLEHRLQLAGRA